jgi:hypothetical protein
MTSFLPSNATCYLKWNSFRGEDPFEQGAIPCTSSEIYSAGRWSMAWARSGLARCW